MPRRHSTVTISEERLAILTKCVEDGWPLKQIQITHRFDFYTIKHFFPEYKGLNRREAGGLAQYSRRANKAVPKPVKEHNAS